MKTTKLSIAFLISLICFISCTQKFNEINLNKNSVTEINSFKLGYLFSKAQSTATYDQSIYQIAQNLFADQYAQYWACTATYFPSDRLVIRQDWVGAAFNPAYNTVLPQLQTIFEKTDPASAEYAMANIIWVFAFHRVTDYWGPVPYFNIGKTVDKNGESVKSVPYDPQDKIYYDFFDRLKNATGVLKTKTKTSESPFGDSDLFFKGNVSKWIMFANSLRLRLALRISSVNPARAQAEAEAAVAEGVMLKSPEDDAWVQRTQKGDGNGLSLMQWSEFRMSAAMESVMKGYDDPRMKVFFMPSKVTHDYDGLRNGLSPAQLTDVSQVNKADYNSQQGPQWSPATLAYSDKNGKVITGISTFMSTPSIVMGTAESYFNRAEGAMKGWKMGETAEELYKMGIKNSFLQWGITDSPNDYMAGNKKPIAPDDFLKSPPMTDIPVKFGTDRNVQEEQIATQKWLALFPDGMEGWADYRRSRKLKLYPVANSDNTDLTDTKTQWIRRINFLLTEKQNNGPAVEAAVSLLGPGGDKITTPLWWDKN